MADNITDVSTLCTTGQVALCNGIVPADRIQYTVDRTAGLTYTKVDFYLANNIYNYLVKNNGQRDPNFEFVAFDEHPIHPFPLLNIRNISVTGRGSITINLALDKSIFTFKYKGFRIMCRVDYDGTNLDVVTHEHRVFTKIYMVFTSNADAGQAFGELIADMVKYTDKYMFDCNSDNKLTIYGNDEGYWEKILTRAKRNMDTIYLPKKDKDSIIDDVKNFLSPEVKARYEAMGRTHKRVYLLEGIPGSGKTSFISALAGLYDYDLALITFTDKLNDSVLIRLLKNLPEKTMLVLEDIDVLFNERKKNDDDKNRISFSGILNALDGITTRDGFICFITTNYKNVLDPALLRPGRIDKQLEFKPAVKEQIQDIFSKFMGEKYTPELFKTFYSAYRELDIDATMSLIQEYLFSYIDNTALAISNIAELKTLYNSCIKAGEAKMYV